MSVRTAYVDGIAFWSPRLPDWEIAGAVFRGEAAPLEHAVKRPSPQLLAPTERRRAPDTVSIALEVAAAACRSAGIEPSSLPSVFASTHGDLAINDYMSRTLADSPTLISPIRFHNSVHNAAAGYWTIGTGCNESYTALSAFECTFGEGLLEALVQASCDGRPVLLVAYDIQAQGPLATVSPSNGMLGVGIIVAPRASAATKAQLSWQTALGEPVTRPLHRNAGLIAENAMAPCLPLFEALAGARGDAVNVGLGPVLSLEVSVESVPVSPSSSDASRNPE
jgi:hypothetical protein